MLIKLKQWTTSCEYIYVDFYQFRVLNHMIEFDFFIITSMNEYTIIDRVEMVANDRKNQDNFLSYFFLIIRLVSDLLGLN
jgi:hypothetical protein